MANKPTTTTVAPGKWVYVPCKLQTGNVQPRNASAASAAWPVHTLAAGTTLCGTYSKAHGLQQATPTMLAMRVSFVASNAAATCKRCISKAAANKPAAPRKARKVAAQAPTAPVAAQAPTAA